MVYSFFIKLTYETVIWLFKQILLVSIWWLENVSCLHAVCFTINSVNSVWVLRMVIQVYCWKGLRFSARQDLEGFSRVRLFFFFAKIQVYKMSKTSVWNLVLIFFCSSLNMALKVLFLSKFCHLRCGPSIKPNQLNGSSVPRRKTQKVLCIKWKNLRYMKYFRIPVRLK